MEHRKHDHVCPLRQHCINLGSTCRGIACFVRINTHHQPSVFQHRFNAPHVLHVVVANKRAASSLPRRLAVALQVNKQAHAWQRIEVPGKRWRIGNGEQINHGYADGKIGRRVIFCKANVLSTELQATPNPITSSP